MKKLRKQNQEKQNQEIIMGVADKLKVQEKLIKKEGISQDMHASETIF